MCLEETDPGEHWPLCHELSLYHCLQQLLSYFGITEEAEFAGQELHLHRHGFILLIINAKGSLSALCAVS